MTVLSVLSQKVLQTRAFIIIWHVQYYYSLRYVDLAIPWEYFSHRSDGYNQATSQMTLYGP